MARPLPALRAGLDFLPSPDRNRPGLVIVDRNGYSDAQIVVPPGLVRALAAYDGEHTADALPPEVEAELSGVLSQCGFLEDSVYEEMRDRHLEAWVRAEHILARHHGPGNYPTKQSDALRDLNQWLTGRPGREVAEPVFGIASPHASPGQTWQTYAAAYGHLRAALSPEAAREKTFVILGTSHYGEPGKFGLTRKTFVTPYGETRVDAGLLRLIQDRAGFVSEDYCFATEHSIEFQVVFLQHLYGADINILPILCGSFMESIHNRSQPEDKEEIRDSIDVLGEVQAKFGDRLVWILGVDLAHVGRRYGDRFDAKANEMEEVRSRDMRRLTALTAAQSLGFWEQICENDDDLKWCGSAPLYTFMKVVPDANGELLDYRHWQIDDKSVVSVGAVRFGRP